MSREVDQIIGVFLILGGVPLFIAFRNMCCLSNLNPTAHKNAQEYVRIQ